MYLPAVLSYRDFRKKAAPFAGPDLYFVYVRGPDSKTWTFAALYLSREDTIEDRLLYETRGVAVEVRTEPAAGGRFEVDEVNENLEGAGWQVRRFVAHDCDRAEGGFELMAEMGWKKDA